MSKQKERLGQKLRSQSRSKKLRINLPAPAQLMCEIPHLAVSAHVGICLTLGFLTAVAGVDSVLLSAVLWTSNRTETQPFILDADWIAAAIHTLTTNKYICYVPLNTNYMGTFKTLPCNILLGIKMIVFF